MNTGQLEHALWTNQLTSKLFRAVVAAYWLPTSSNQRGTYVVNTDPHYLPRQHWVVLHFTSDQVFYFDPMGTPITKHLLDQLRSSRTFSEKMLQHAVTSRIQGLWHTCGFYCAYYILCLANPGLYKLDIFSDNLDFNNRLVCNLFIRMFPIKWERSKMICLVLLLMHKPH